MKTRLLTLFALSFASPVAAQTWTKTLMDSGVYFNALPVAERADQVWVGSGARLLHLDADGSVLEQTQLSDLIGDLRMLADGSRIVCGFSSGWIARYDPMGMPEWGWYISPSGLEEYVRFRAFDLRTDGGIYAIGERSIVDFAAGDEWSEMLLTRFDGSGTLLWELSVADTADESYFSGTDVVALVDGSAFFVARGKQFRPLCGRVSATGQLLWMKQFGSDVGGWFPRVVQLPSGDLIAVDGGRLVVRLDDQGAAVWKRRFPQGYAVEGIAAAPDGGVLVTGGVTLPNAAAPDLYLARLSASGDLVWQGVQGNEGDDLGANVVVASNGDLLVSGRKKSDGRAIIQRLDALGGSPGCDVVPGFAQLEVVDEANVVVSEPWGPVSDPLVADPLSPTDSDLGVLDVCLSRAVGVRYCDPGVPNSTGLAAVVWAAGATSISSNALTLVADVLPPNQFGYFLVGMGTGVTVPPGSQGNLCLIGGPIHRYASSIGNSGAAGAFAIGVDLNDTITGYGSKIGAGETWNFQAWFRDQNPGSTSNFTDAIAVTFVP